MPMQAENNCQHRISDYQYVYRDFKPKSALVTFPDFAQVVYLSSNLCLTESRFAERFTVWSCNVLYVYSSYISGSGVLGKWQ